MSKEKLFDHTVKYLKYYKDFNNYPVFFKDLKEVSGNSAFVVSDESEITEEEPVSAISNLPTEPVVQMKEAEEPAGKEPVSERWMECISLTEFQNEIKDCSKCSHLANTRKQIVFGSGNPDADVVIVGEAPGADEDEQGYPFVGKAGKLLTDILKAINFTREEVYICNILKCRPPDNRNPLPDEIVNCEPYLFKQLEMIKPKLILAVGAFAAKTLLRCNEPLGKMRGKFHSYNGIKMMVTYHPAALLRNPNWKRPTWEDVQLFRKEYDSIVSSEK